MSQTTDSKSDLGDLSFLDQWATEFKKFQEREKSEETLFQANTESENGLGFPASEIPSSYEPQALNARHREILRLVALGYKHTQVGAMLSISPVTVGYVVRSPLGQSFLSEIQEARTGSVKDVHNRLQEMSPFAAEIMLDIMANSKSEGNKLKAAEKVLEMTGHKAENKHVHLMTQLSAEDIKELKNTAQKFPELDEDLEVVIEETEALENTETA